MFPYIVLTIFFIRGITLKGAGEGIKHMYTPKVIKMFLILHAIFFSSSTNSLVIKMCWICVPMLQILTSREHCVSLIIFVE